MMNKLFILILIFCSQLVFAQGNKLRTLSLEWDVVSDAKSYELEIKDLVSGKVLEKISQESKWRGQLPMGQYQYRIRSIDERNAYSDWTDWESFTLKFPWPKPIEPSKDQKIIAKSQGLETVNFSWRPITIADKYYFEIRGENQLVFKKEIVQSTSLKMNLPVGQKYTWTVASLAKDDNDLKLENLNHNFQIIGGQLDAPKINLNATHLDESVVWVSVKNAQSYSVQLEKRDSLGNWRLAQQESNWPNNHFPLSQKYGDGNFRLTIKAMNDRFQDSQETIYDFNRDQNRKPAQAQSSITEGYISDSSFLHNKYFTWGMGSITSNYQFSYLDTYYAGSGNGYRIYLKEILPLPSYEANLNIKWEMNLYNSNGVSVNPSFVTGIWEKQLLSAGDHSIGWGLFYKETPILGNVGPGSQNSFPVIQSINTAGPIIAMNSRGVFSARTSWNFDTSVFFNIFNIKTPDGSNLDPNFGYRFDSKIYFAKIASSPIYLGISYLNNEVRFINTTAQVGFVTGQKMPPGSSSFTREETISLLFGSDLSF